MAVFWLKQKETNAEKIAAVNKQRNKYYAHLDKLSDAKLMKILNNNIVTYEDMMNLLTLNINICNAIYTFFWDSTVFPMIVGYDDLKITINEIKE